MAKDDFQRQSDRITAGEDPPFPIADGCAWFFCNKCDGLHLRLERDGEPIAGITIDPEIFAEMVKEMRGRGNLQ